MKNSIKQRIFAILLCIAILITSVNIDSLLNNFGAIEHEGVPYTYSGTTLTITGTGVVKKDWQTYDNTWAGQVTKITAVVFNSATLTDIEDDAFDGCTALNTLTFTNYNSKLDTSAFKNINTIKTITIGNTIEEIAPNVFERRN